MYAMLGPVAAQNSLPDPDMHVTCPIPGAPAVSHDKPPFTLVLIESRYKPPERPTVAELKWRAPRGTVLMPVDHVAPKSVERYTAPEMLPNQRVLPRSWTPIGRIGYGP